MPDETVVPQVPQVPQDEATSPSERVVVVGIGASAGGLKALQKLVEAIPPDSGMAYVVIVHLDPDRVSRMPELLQDKASIPVTQVTEATEVEADHIYVVPPDRDLEMRGSVIGVRERSDRSHRVPIDLFFQTLAEVAGSDAVGVVLSGSGEDGTAGIRAIRKAGGITVAQAPDEAEYDSMPSSAIATGRVDLVLASSSIPAELIRLRRESPLVAAGGADSDDVEPDLARILATLRTRTGHDFSMYKRSTVLRRLDRRLLFNGVDTLGKYLRLLKTSEAECQSLLGDLLISVSSFFRDPAAFEALAGFVPELFEGKGAADTVRVWVAGCATGEEVYSLAMILAEHAATLEDPPRVQMFATDIDENGYAGGREGLYPAAAVARVGPERLARFFTKEPTGYRVSKALREMVLFALHNGLSDPPFAQMDLISCRNLFIYLQPDAQQHMLETFHYALEPEGMLFLGASESVGDPGLFSPMGPEAHRIFRRNGTSHRVLPRLSAADPGLPRVGRSASGPPRATGGPATAPFSYGTLHLHMLERYAQPSLVVDERWDVVHLSDGAGRFLRLGEGEPSRHLMDLARDDLRTALRTAVHQAFDNGLPTSRPVRIEVDGAERDVIVHVRPWVGSGQDGDFALVLFENGDARSRDGAGPPGSGESPDPPLDPEASETTDASELEAELARTREQLDSTSAAYDHTVAELQAANQELRSINEEQKATSEELETGREEIQAINEELTTINQEHQTTIGELKRTNADLQNLIESTEIGTIFVDRAMRVRRFTPPVTGIFNFVPTDHGRPLGDITHRLDYPELIDDVARVLEDLERIEREADSDDGASYIVRINPYRSHDGEVDGAVMTFFDHTEHHTVLEALRDATAEAQSANAAKVTFLSTLSHELRTPLSSMMGYAELLQLGDTLTEEQDKKVERILAGGRHLVSMIENLLDFARLDGGREIVRPEKVDARTIAADVRTLIGPLAEAKGLAFDVEAPDDPVEVSTDVGKARQIVLNLCQNAVKYTESGAIRLRVDGADDRVVLEVRDTGIGIAAEHRERVFDRFWQVDGGPTRVGGGLGIGLAAAREYARLLGGDVELESAPGRGSTFRLWLPGPA